jgi:hypothetical protein
VPPTKRRARRCLTTSATWEQNEELEAQDEVGGHIEKLDANTEPDDDVEAHIKIN